MYIDNRHYYQYHLKQQQLFWVHWWTKAFPKFFPDKFDNDSICHILPANFIISFVHIFNVFNLYTCY